MLTIIRACVRQYKSLFVALMLPLVVGGMIDAKADEAHPQQQAVSTSVQKDNEALDPFISILDQMSREVVSAHYDPLKIVTVVNALQPLGKPKALAVMRHYLQRRPGSEGLFLVLRVLFDVPTDPGYMPPMLIGAFYPPVPEDLKVLPRFPIALLDDLPLLLVGGRFLDGVPQLVEEHLAYFEKHGVLRASPLRPTNRPLGLLAKFEASDQWVFGKVYGKSIFNSSLELQEMTERSILWDQLRRVEEKWYPDPKEQHYTLNERLVMAVEANRVQEVRSLLRQGADVNSRDLGGDTVLMLSVSCGCDQSFQVLLESGADVQSKRNDGTTVLMKAAERNDGAMVAALLAKGADMDAKDRKGRTALLRAERNVSLKAIRLLKQAGAKE